MKTVKKSIGIIITVLLIMLGSVPVIASSAEFADVPPSHWAYEYIRQMHDREIMLGFDGLFQPNEKVTRGQFSVVLAHLAEIDDLQIIPYWNSDFFADTRSHWCHPYAAAMKKYFGGIEQNGANYFYPDKEATREEIAIAFVKIKGYDISVYDDAVLEKMFTDWQSVLPPARAYIAAAVDNGILSGYEDGTFRPHQGITRAELSALACRVYPKTNI